VAQFGPAALLPATGGRLGEKGERESEREGGEQGVQCYVTRMYRREKSTYLTRYAIRWHGTYRVTPGATYVARLDSARLGLPARLDTRPGIRGYRRSQWIPPIDFVSGGAANRAPTFAVLLVS